MKNTKMSFYFSYSCQNQYSHINIVTFGDDTYNLLLYSMLRVLMKMNTKHLKMIMFPLWCDCHDNHKSNRHYYSLIRDIIYNYSAYIESDCGDQYYM